MSDYVFQCLSFFLFFSIAWAVEPCENALQEIDKTQMRIKGDHFKTSRGIDVYIERFPVLEQLLSRKTPTFHWVDVGAGQAKAMEDYLIKNVEKLKMGKDPGGNPVLVQTGEYYEFGQTRARTTAITVGERSVTNSGIIKELGQKFGFRCMKGRLIEDIPLAEIGEADLITDLQGALMYTHSLDTTLTHMLKLLKPNGRLISFLTEDTVIKSQTREVILIKIWLAEIKGVEVLWGESINGHPFFVINRISGEVSVPRLKLASFKDGGPPKRVFIWGSENFIH